MFEKIQPAGPILTMYAGVETASCFGNMGEEFRALTAGCGIYDLRWRASILLTGSDRVRWLNGMVTNNIKDLPVNRGNYNFVLNPQGRIQGDLDCYNRQDSILLETEHSQVENLLKIFEHYIIMDDVELQEIGAKLTAVGVQGPQARQLFTNVGMDLPPMETGQISDLTWKGTGFQIIRTTNERYDTFEIWAGPESTEEIRSALVAAGARPAGTDALEKFRVMMGTPRYGIDIRERDLPQETRQDRALNFTKGCYVGQEIVERIRSRGAVHRQFAGFVLDGATPSPGTRLESEGKEAGEITSVNMLPLKNTGDRTVALGYVRREAFEKKQILTYPGGQAAISQLPFAVA